MDKLFTIMRNLPGDAEDKPNALLFASEEFIDDATMDQVFQDAQLRALLPPGKPVMCLRYYKDEDVKFGFKAEWRLILSSLSYFIQPLNDMHSHVSLTWDEPSTTGGPVEVKKIHYGELLTGCTELFRVMGCEGCSKKGKECVIQQVGSRPWPFTMSYNRRDDWSISMADEGTITERFAKNKEHEFQGKDLAAVQKAVAKLSPAGFHFRASDKTKVTNSPKMNQPLRPARDHRFYKAPKAPAAAGAEASADAETL